MPATGDQISPHEVRVLEVLRATPGLWLSNEQVAGRASVNVRTARQHTRNLVRLGVLEADKVFGGYRYRAVPEPGAAAADYLARWERARAIFAASPAA